MVEQDCPDIALIDLELPPFGGIAAVQQLAKRCSSYAIVWSFEPTRETVLAAVCSGAHGFLHKEISPDGLVRALRGVVQGEAPLSRDLASLMIDALHGHDEQARARDRAGVLSSRECEVLDLVAQGARNKQIAALLTISEFTVKRHVQNILQKLSSRRARRPRRSTELRAVKRRHLLPPRRSHDLHPTAARRFGAASRCRRLLCSVVGGGREISP